jgi:hypothetical protein
MKRILLLSLLTTAGFSQTAEWIYYNKDGIWPDGEDAYRIKPDGTENELIMDNNQISDISGDGLKILLHNFYSNPISLIDSESMDTLTVYNDGINPRFTYDENVIIYYKEMDDNPGGNHFYKYSFIDSSETLIADSVGGATRNAIMSPDKQKFVFFQNNQDSMDVVIADIQSGQTSTLVTVIDMSNSFIPIFHSYWGLDDYIYLNLPDSNYVSQLFRIHSSNTDASLIQLTEENASCMLLESNDIHLEKLAFAILDTVREYWLYDFESNETSYLGDMDSSIWALHQTWSPDNSKIAIGRVWATGIYTPGPINIFDTVTDSFTTLVDSTWPPCFWVGETGEQVSIIDETLPITYNLYNAYPNPFNPVTTIRYELPETGLVNITIYDMLGRQVKTLINQTQDAGYRSIIWDATNDYGKLVSAGIYLYQIQAGEYMQTKKMVLLK